MQSYVEDDKQKRERPHGTNVPATIGVCNVLLKHDGVKRRNNILTLMDTIESHVESGVPLIICPKTALQP